MSEVGNRVVSARCHNTCKSFHGDKFKCALGPSRQHWNVFYNQLRLDHLWRWSSNISDLAPVEPAAVSETLESEMKLGTHLRKPSRGLWMPEGASHLTVSGQEVGTGLLLAAYLARSSPVRFRVSLGKVQDRKPRPEDFRLKRASTLHIRRATYAFLCWRSQYSLLARSPSPQASGKLFSSTSCAAASSDSSFSILALST